MYAHENLKPVEISNLRELWQQNFRGGTPSQIVTPRLLPDLLPGAQVEVRSIPSEIRMIDVGGKPKIRGYAAVFNARSQSLTTPDGDEFIEEIVPGAFKDSLEGGADVRCLYNHESNALLGRRSSGTLVVGEDAGGLYFECDPPDTTTGHDVAVLLQRGDLTGASFSFSTVKDSWSTDSDGAMVRSLQKAHLFDVGPVTFPAYLQASAAYRSLDHHKAAAVAAQTPLVVYPTPEQRKLLHELALTLLD